jgi:hypothetical protein
MNYRHTQCGWVILLTCAALLLLCAAVLLPTQAPRGVICLLSTMLLLAIVALMGSLTVEVDRASLRLRFGIGLVRKTFSLDEVAACEPVRNNWWWGWGIRRFPGGWLYNVSGLDAVELRLMNGKRYRIGTDEPQRLSDCIRARLGQTGGAR